MAHTFPTTVLRFFIFMPKYQDLTGQVFGQLTVIGYKPGSNGERSMRICQCTCGNVCLKHDKYLKDRIRRSCGCHLNQDTKICALCKINKPKSEYHPLKTKKIGVQSKCKECCTLYRKEKYWGNRDIELAKMTKSRLKPENVLQRKSYYENKKDEYNARYKKYMQDENKKLHKSRVSKAYQKTDHGKETAKKRYTHRMKNDMWYILRKRISRRVRAMVVEVAKNRCGKRLRTMELLGCSISFFKEYFESRFTEGMCWERISEIHIDHIKPCRKFDLSDIEQQKLCFHYSNLQPLWCVDNLIKGCKYEDN